MAGSVGYRLWTAWASDLRSNMIVENVQVSVDNQRNVSARALSPNGKNYYLMNDFILGHNFYTGTTV